MDPLAAYVPRLATGWGHQTPATREAIGSMAFVDVSGFTTMSERLARHGKVGAEEVAHVIDERFSVLLGVAYGEGGQLLKFGGDALLLFFSGDEHALRAARAAAGMRAALRAGGHIDTTAGKVTLRMSVGVHTGAFHLFLVGRSHHELMMAGPAVSRTVAMESAASAGQILLSPEAAVALPARHRGRQVGPGVLLAGTPAGRTGPAMRPEPHGPDLAPALPTALREHLLAGGQEREHRLCAIAFLHVGGVDTRLRASGPRAVRDDLHAVITAAQEAADAYGITFLGTDIARDGAKVILVAGAPVARSDPDGRLLRAVRAIVDGAPPLPIRVGVNRGHVFAGDVGPSFRRTYTVMGDAVNLAARLMSRAGDGEVIVAPEVVGRSGTPFHTEPLPPFTVKGKARPVHAVRLGAIRAGRPEATSTSSPLVGREDEVRGILASLEEARPGTPKAVEVIGEPGLGKTRLVEEVAARAEGVTVLRTAAEAYEASTPYFPFRVMLQDLAGIAPDASDERAAQGLREAVDGTGLEPWLPLLGAVLGLDLPDTPQTRDLESRFRRDRLEDAVLGLVTAMVSGPVLLIVEDAHWLDDATADLLAAAVDGEERPWLVCVTRRDTPTSLRLPPERTLTVRLEPLPAEAAAALVATETEAWPLHPHEARALAERAGGNPLFLRELLASRGTEGDLPDTVESAISARIDRLPPADRDALRRLAVLGPAFDPDLATAVLEDEATAMGCFSRLEAFLAPDGQAYRFRHALIRDVAYERLPYRLRRELHARVGERIERTAFPDVNHHAEALALHYSEAGRDASAWIYARVAAGRAEAVYANVEAASFYERGLRAARGLDTVPDQVTAGLWESLGDVRARMGEFAGATAAYGTARRLRAGDPIAQANLLRKEAGVARRAGRFTDALRRLTRGHGALAEVSGPDAARERARLSAWYASVRQEQGRSAEAVAWCHRAIEEAQESGADDVLAHASYLLDWAYVLQGRLDEATHSERALAIFEDLGDLAGQANVLNNLGGFAYERGRWDEAVAFYERARAVREKTGDAVNAAFGTINVAEILADQGHLEEAERRIREALRVWRAAGYRSGVAFALLLLGRVAARAGRHEEALDHLGEARAEFGYVGASHDLVAVDARVAEVRVLMGDATGAAGLARDTLDRAASIEPAQVHEPLLRRVLGQAALLAGDPDAAHRELERSLDVARARDAGFEAALTLRALAEVARARGDEPRGARLEEEAAPVLEAAGVVSLPLPSRS